MSKATAQVLGALIDIGVIFTLGYFAAIGFVAIVRALG